MLGFFGVVEVDDDSELRTHLFEQRPYRDPFIFAVQILFNL
jgi:hypothetical protein